MPEVAWTFGKTPSISESSSSDGYPDDHFIGAVRTHSGIAVATWHDQELRFYDRGGSVVARWPTSRDTIPHLLWIGRCPGNNLIAAQDYRSERVFFLSDSGALLRSVGIPHEQAFAQLLMCPRDGSLLLLHRLPRAFTTEGVSTSLSQIVRVDSHGHSQVLREFGGTEYFYSARDRIFVGQPLGKMSLAAATDSELLFGTSDQRTIELMGALGGQRGHFTTNLVKRPATIGDLLAAVTQRVYEEPSPKTREILRSAIVQAPDRTAELLFDDMRTDGYGNLWLKTFEVARTDSVRWRIFSTAGLSLGYCDLPSDLFVQEVGRDYITGIRRGPGEPERAAVFEFIKPLAGSKTQPSDSN